MAMSKKLKSSKLYSPSADIIGGNEYLLSIVLPCLPVSSLVRFKSVSKQWHSLISDPQFGLNHTLKNSVSRIPSGLFFCNSLTGAKTFDSVSISKFGCKIPLLSDTVELTADVPTGIRNELPVSISMNVVQSCNGLILVEYYSAARFFKLYCVRNLVTKQQRFVPLPNLEDVNRRRIISCFLAFDPLVSPHYKLVGVEYYPVSNFLIYSSETGQWKNTDAKADVLGWSMHNAKGVYCNGSIYWIPNDVYRILYCYRFDVEDENLIVVSMPRGPRTADNSYLQYFGGFNGHLNLVYVRDVSAKKFNVLELDDVTMKWFVKYRVHINCLISPFPEIVVEGTKYAFSILSVTSGEKEEDSALIMAIPGKVVSYNFRSKKVDVLCEFPQNVIKMKFHYDSAYPFVASLYPL